MWSASVLIIDDDASLRELMAELLKSDGHHVVTSESALAAFDTDLPFLPDIIVLDLMMPGMDGFTFLQKLREAQETKRIKILIVSAKDSPEDRVRGLTLGADDFISKPFDTDEFRARVRNQARITLQERRHIEEEAKGRLVQFLRESLSKLST